MVPLSSLRVAMKRADLPDPAVDVRIILPLICIYAMDESISEME